LKCGAVSGVLDVIGGGRASAINTGVGAVFAK
jgi:hypothetical protein